MRRPSRNPAVRMLQIKHNTVVAVPENDRRVINYYLIICVARFDDLRADFNNILSLHT
jgi:hypothetical protein